MTYFKPEELDIFFTFGKGVTKPYIFGINFNSAISPEINLKPAFDFKNYVLLGVGRPAIVFFQLKLFVYLH